jgi:hypothetical protein
MINALSSFGSFKRLTNMMWRSLSELFFFLVLFLFMVLAFALAGMIIYGQHLKDFHTLFDSFTSMFSIVIGDYDDSDIFGFVSDRLSVSYLLNLLFIWLYNIGMVWILLNVFITICMDAYEGAKEKMQDPKMMVEYMPINRLAFANTRPLKRIIKTIKAMREKDSTGIISREDLLKLFESKGVKRQSIPLQFLQLTRVRAYDGESGNGKSDKVQQELLRQVVQLQEQLSFLVGALPGGSGSGGGGGSFSGDRSFGGAGDGGGRSGNSETNDQDGQTHAINQMLTLHKHLPCSPEAAAAIAAAAVGEHQAMPTATAVHATTEGGDALPPLRNPTTPRDKVHAAVLRAHAAIQLAGNVDEGTSKHPKMLMAQQQPVPTQLQAKSCGRNILPGLQLKQHATGRERVINTSSMPPVQQLPAKSGVSFKIGPELDAGASICRSCGRAVGSGLVECAACQEFRQKMED